MHNALFFAIGFLIGALFGIVLMSLLQINRLNGKEEKTNEKKKCSYPILAEP